VLSLVRTPCAPLGGAPSFPLPCTGKVLAYLQHSQDPLVAGVDGLEALITLSRRDLAARQILRPYPHNPSTPPFASNGWTTFARYHAHVRASHPTMPYQPGISGISTTGLDRLGPTTPLPTLRISSFRHVSRVQSSEPHQSFVLASAGDTGQPGRMGLSAIGYPKRLDHDAQLRPCMPWEPSSLTPVPRIPHLSAACTVCICLTTFACSSQ
jgi:hypothetical protein